ncbi:MAG: hypothetical protein WB791_11550 [Waddliaceae bacterium]
MSNRMHCLTIWLFLLSFCFFPSLSQGQAEEHQQYYNYPNPGLVVFRNGRWIGSDYLYNLSDHIPVIVEIVKPQAATVPFTEAMVQEHVADIFRKANIEPSTGGREGEFNGRQPTLPFFHLLIMIYPFENGYVALCEGSLFEKVTLDRVHLAPEATLQAITWEMQTLILSPEKELLDQLKQSLDRIAKEFADRFRFYAGVKSQIKTSP